MSQTAKAATKSTVSAVTERERNSLALHKATSNIGGLADSLKRDLARLDAGLPPGLRAQSVFICQSANPVSSTRRGVVLPRAREAGHVTAHSQQLHSLQNAVVQSLKQVHASAEIKEDEAGIGEFLSFQKSLEIERAACELRIKENQAWVVSG